MDNPNRYYTVTEAAHELGVVNRTVIRYIKDGRFPGAYQIPGGATMPWLIPIDEVEAVKATRKRK